MIARVRDVHLLVSGDDNAVWIKHRSLFGGTSVSRVAFFTRSSHDTRVAGRVDANDALALVFTDVPISLLVKSDRKGFDELCTQSRVFGTLPAAGNARNRRGVCGEA